MSEKYLIWSNEHRAWWAPFERGYVPRVFDAGRYSRDRALEICRNAIGTAMHIRMLAELPVREADLVAFLDGQILPGCV